MKNTFLILLSLFSILAFDLKSESAQEYKSLPSNKAPVLRSSKDPLAISLLAAIDAEDRERIRSLCIEVANSSLQDSTHMLLECLDDRSLTTTASVAEALQVSGSVEGLKLLLLKYEQIGMIAESHRSYELSLEAKIVMKRVLEALSRSCTPPVDSTLPTAQLLSTLRIRILGEAEAMKLENEDAQKRLHVEISEKELRRVQAEYDLLHSNQKHLTERVGPIAAELPNRKASPTPWKIIVGSIVAVIGLLWLLLKRHS